MVRKRGMSRFFLFRPLKHVLWKSVGSSEKDESFFRLAASLSVVFHFGRFVAGGKPQREKKGKSVA